MTLRELVKFVRTLVERIERLEDTLSARLCSEQMAHATKFPPK